MRDPLTVPSEFWDAVAAHVTTEVEPVLERDRRARRPVIAYPRDLDAVAPSECGRRAAIQVIASRRRVHGDRGDVGPRDGRLSRT